MTHSQRPLFSVFEPIDSMNGSNKSLILTSHLTLYWHNVTCGKSDCWLFLDLIHSSAILDF